MTESAQPQRQPSESYWPYVTPIMAFLLLIEISARVGEAGAAAMLAVRVAVPLGLLIYFWRRGEYPELRFHVTAMTAVDILLGVGLAAMWMAPFILFPNLQPEFDATEMNPLMAGASLVPLVMAIRMLGYAIVTPWMEEIFMRSFLMRFADVLDPNGDESDYRKVPVARFTWRSFLVVVAVFLATHQLWEAWVMLPWAVTTNLWFYYRKDLFALIAVHAATNASILVATMMLNDHFTSGDGTPMSLWFFV
ncbi:CPBP family glutamic-type intramembrane protease [Rubripirellula reticaptiva]|uniref:CAAX amino terminal protease self-immunity n=1 Tax=Rubripirellula reticaptiva TaxID=2528013 RepID=A0A5C6ELZ2_9BACT|nr:CPBP family glutamic-type intramembrane protease [Rubripirellula reticaptiva]TWU48309.1 CAAX amino terminal protease self- immunity [Rubripirellula reticaptiva]